MVVCLVLSALLFAALCAGALVIVDVVLVEWGLASAVEQPASLNGWVLNLSLLVSAGFFLVLFLFLLGERLSYIRDIVKGIDALRSGAVGYEVPLEGNNELTRLAESVNFLALAQQQVRERERALNEDREQLIRSLSHDIRTPLTTISSYAELLAGQEECEPWERRQRAALIQEKAVQIRELTDILLDGGKRRVERFDDARLLMEQLVAEFEESLEDAFTVEVDLGGCPAFAGSFDVQELRRTFDNLASNVRKYADPAWPVKLSVFMEEGRLVIWQRNAVRRDRGSAESYQMGLSSIRRIAHSYAGQVEVRQGDEAFEIRIVLSEF